MVSELFYVMCQLDLGDCVSISELLVHCPWVGPGPPGPRADPDRTLNGQGRARGWVALALFDRATGHGELTRTSGLDRGRTGPAPRKMQIPATSVPLSSAS